MSMVRGLKETLFAFRGSGSLLSKTQQKVVAVVTVIIQRSVCLVADFVGFLCSFAKEV